MIEKRISIDKIEIVGDDRIIQTRLKVEIVEDGEVIGKLPSVRLSAKTPNEDIAVHPDITVGKQKIKLPQAIVDELSAVAGTVWTQAVKDKCAEKVKK